MIGPNWNGKYGIMALTRLVHHHNDIYKRVSICLHVLTFNTFSVALKQVIACQFITRFQYNRYQGVVSI